MSTGERILQNRQAAGLTQAELAREIGADSSSISRWERGLVKPSADHLRGMSRVFGVAIEDLLGDDESSCAQDDGGSLAEGVANA